MKHSKEALLAQAILELASSIDRAAITIASAITKMSNWEDTDFEDHESVELGH